MPFNYVKTNCFTNFFKIGKCNLCLNRIFLLNSFIRENNKSKLNLWQFYHLTFKCDLDLGTTLEFYHLTFMCDLDLQTTWTNISYKVASFKRSQCEGCSIIIYLMALYDYRNVLKNWDTQRIGTSLKIVKIIILADPKNWTILRKRKNIRNFSDPKNWDGVFGAPKWSKTCLTLLVYKRCPHVWSRYSLVNKGDTAKTTPLLWFSMQFCLKEYTEMKYLPSNMSQRLCVT